jgi:hypothetical protein
LTNSLLDLQWAKWEVEWTRKYRWKKEAYDTEAKAYLTRKALGHTSEAWERLGKSQFFFFDKIEFRRSKSNFESDRILNLTESEAGVRWWRYTVRGCVRVSRACFRKLVIRLFSDQRSEDCTLLRPFVNPIRSVFDRYRRETSPLKFGL